MSRRIVLVAGFLITAFAPVAPAFAQMGGQTTFGVAAGLSTSTGTFANRTNAGFNISGSATMQQPGQPVAIRIEGMYNEFDNSDVPGSNTQILALTANAVITGTQMQPRRAATTTPSGPYLLVGVGLYNVKEPDPVFVENDYTNNIGFNIGGGYRFALSGFSAYIEARWHKVVNTDYTFVPITFGIAF